MGIWGDVVRLFHYLYRSSNSSIMQIRSTIAVLVMVATLSFSCKSDGDAARDAAVQQIQNGQPAPADATTANPATQSPEPAQNAAGVWHYTCPKGCEGGGGSAVACAKCGTTLVHNAAYHPPTNGAAPAQAATPPNHATSLPEGMTPVQNPLNKQEPAQNAKGVWHYTCPGGCAGGGGSAIACAKCGKTLAHNQAYHQ